MTHTCRALQPPNSSPETQSADPSAHSPKPVRSTQRDRLYTLLYGRRNEWVALPQILELRIAQYGTRLKELRELGADIRNRKEAKDGTVHSWYMLVIPEVPR